MDPTEDLSARVLLKHILSTETPRTPITRSVSKSTSATRRSNRHSMKDAGAQTPQDILRSSLRQKMRESITRKSLPATKRKTSSATLRKINTSATTAMLFDEGETPRHMLMNILRTEPVKSPVVHERRSSEGPQPSSANSTMTRTRSSIELSGLELPDLTITNAASTAKGLSRKRPRRSFNVTAFEKRLKDGDVAEEEVEESIDDHSSLSLSGSTSLSLKTPFVDVRTERRGIQRRVSNRRKITVEEFGAAVHKRHMGGMSSFAQVERDPSETAHSEGITLGLSKLSEPDITTDIVNCNTALYAQTDTMTSSFSIVASQDKPTVMASQLQREMELEEPMEVEQSKLGKDKSGYVFLTEEGVVAEAQDDKYVSESVDGPESQKEERTAHGQPEHAGVIAKSEEEEDVAESQPSVTDDTAESEEENGVEAQTEEEGEGEVDPQPEADIGLFEEEEAASDTHTEEEDEAAAGSQTEEEEEEEAAARSQTEEEEEEEAVAESQTEEETAAESQTEEEEEDEEAVAESQTEEETAAESQTEEETAAESQTEEEEEDEEAVAESPTEEEEEEAAAGSHAEEEEEEEETAAESQTEEEEEEADSQPQEDIESGPQSEEDEDVAQNEDEKTEEQLEHISRRSHRSEGPLIMAVGDAGEDLSDITAAGRSGARSKAHSALDLHSSLEMRHHENNEPDLAESSTPEQRGSSYTEDEADAHKENSFHHPEVSQEDKHRGQLVDDLPEEEEEEEEEDEAPAEDAEEESDDEEDGEDSSELPCKTPAFVKEKRNFFDADLLGSPVFKNIQSSGVRQASPAAKPKQVRQRKKVPAKKAGSLPKSYLMKVFRHFAKTKVSADVYPVLNETMEKFFERLAADLETYAAHAKRKTIEVEDAVLLLRRQGYVNDKVPVEVLIEKYLRMDQRKILIPIATSGNVVIPKKRR